MRSADALLLLNADYPHTERIINAKTFEYMAARRPMFVVAPAGDMTELVAGLPGTVLTCPRDPGGIADRLALEIERHRCGVRLDDGNWDIDRFERRRLAEEFAGLLDSLADRPHGHGARRELRARKAGRNEDSSDGARSLSE
jgi:hypothetical protein